MTAPVRTPSEATGDIVRTRDHDGPHGRSGRVSQLPRWIPPVVGTTFILGGIAALWFLASALQLWPPATLPAPAAVLGELASLVTSEPTFWSDFAQTVVEMVISFAGGVVIGGLLGLLFWKLPILGKILEPYLVSFYAVPFVLFYPILIVVVGLNQWSIIVLATGMSIIPMALNSWIGLETIRPVYLRVARSLCCSEREMITKVAVPAAAVQILAGIRLAAYYAIIGVIAMEFLLAPEGLGFQVRYQYHYFQTPTMFAYILVIFVLAMTVITLVSLLENYALRHQR